MKTLTELHEKLNSLQLDNPTFLVTIHEDEYENTSDPNHYGNDSFDSIEDAYEDYLNELKDISSFVSDSEYKQVEIVAITEDGNYEVLDSETYVQQYSAEDYGKYLISYLPTNNGIKCIEVNIIDAYTKFQVSADGRYSTKFQIEDTKEDAVKFIYEKSLYLSMEDVAEMLEISLR